ncbi:MAG: glycosyltransferase family 4 protein [Paludibacter sp.]|nr:glycosyltransferase family 4 protein [Paludibacter sp.]
MKKVLFILHYPPPVHGAAMVGLQIKDSKIINETFEYKYINLGTSQTIEEIGKTKVVKLFRYIRILYQVLWNIIFNRPDLCYISMTAKCTPFYKDASLALLVKLFGIKLVYHFHNKGVTLYQDSFFDNLLYRIVFKNSRVILLSEYLYPDIQKYVNKDHVYYCANGITDIEITPNNRNKKDVIELLFLSNLMESKGVFVLLEVCQILKRKKINFHCTFVGGAGDISEYEFRSKVLEMDLIDHVKYVGKKFGKDKENAFNNADIFVHPTFNDCFPLVLLEAMQYSLPVVSTLEGGIPDIVDEGVTGFLVNQKDVEAFADKIEILINNPELRLQMGQTGRLKYEKDFIVDKFEYRFNGILQQIIEKEKIIEIPQKKILFILHIPPPVHGSSVVGKLVNNSNVINNSFECSYINLLISRTMNETGKLSFLKACRFISLCFELIMQMIKKKPDICYIALTTTGASFYKDVLLVGILRIFNVKRIYHLHNKGVSKFQNKKSYKLLYPYVFKDADIILLSNKLYKDIEQFVPKSRVHICPNGIEDIASDSTQQLPSTTKIVKILFLSNLIDSKGIFVLLDACLILRKKGIEFECDFIGAEGDLSIAKFNKKVQKNGLTKNVSYLGKKYGKDKQDAFTNADIFAFPTYYPNECFPLVLLEAMQFSLPIVSTFEGGIPDIVDEGITGYLVLQKNVKALAEKLELLILNPELRQQMGKAGRLKYEKEFTLAKFENRMKEILQLVVEV